MAPLFISNVSCATTRDIFAPLYALERNSDVFISTIMSKLRILHLVLYLVRNALGHDDSIAGFHIS